MYLNVDYYFAGHGIVTVNDRLAPEVHMFAITQVNKDGLLSFIALSEYQDALIVYSAKLTCPSAAAKRRTLPVVWMKEHKSRIDDCQPKHIERRAWPCDSKLNNLPFLKLRLVDPRGML